MSFRLLFFLAFFILFLILQKWSPHRRKTPQLRSRRLTNLGLGAFNLSLVVVFGQLTQLLSTHTPSWMEVTAGVFLLDFLAYCFHRLFHLNSFLFRFHSVHHSDASIEVTSAFRFHFGEVLVANSARILCAWALGFSYVTLFIFELVFLFFNLFEHSNFQLPQKLSGFLSFLWITPALHRKHHSILHKEMNSNFGTVFSIWDRLLRTYTPGGESEDFPMGLSKGQQERGFLKALALPFSSWRSSTDL